MVSTPRGRHPHLMKPPQDVWFFPFDGGGILFRTGGGRRIWCLNLTSAVIWCFLDQYGTLNELVDGYEKRFSIDRETACRDVTATVDFFRAEGLLDASPAERVSDPGQHRAVPSVSTGPDTERPPHDFDWAFQKTYRCQGHQIELWIQDTPDEILRDIHLPHLEVPGTSRPPDTHLWGITSAISPSNLDIFVNGHLFAHGIDPRSLPPMIFSIMFMRISASLSSRLLFHAAVVGKNHQTVLFPGEAGSGKTTLSAVLLQHEFRFFSDELAVLDIDHLTVSPLLMPMSIKSGALDTLISLYPELRVKTSYSRDDGKQVRFLMPPASHMAAETESAGVHVLIFPRYGKTEPLRLTSLDKSDALRQLVRTTSSDRCLHPSDISALIHIVERTPCYSLTYSDAGKAAQLIDRRFEELNQ